MHDMKTCPKCQGPKDRPGQSYCLACHATEQREWRAIHLNNPNWVNKQKGLAVKICTNCGKPREKPKQSHCLACHAADERARRAAKKDPVKTAARALEKAEFRTERRRVRKVSQDALRTGLLTRMPCVACGDQAEMHHQDYGAPLDVTWVCRAHHVLITREERRHRPWRR